MASDRCRKSIVCTLGRGTWQRYLLAPLWFSIAVGPTTCGRGHDPDTCTGYQGERHSCSEPALTSKMPRWVVQKLDNFSAAWSCHPLQQTLRSTGCVSVSLWLNVNHILVFCLQKPFCPYTDSFGINHIQEEHFVTTNGNLPSNYLLTNRLY